MDHSERKQSSTEQVQWEHLVESTFDRPERKISVAGKAPAASGKKPASGRKKWPWVVLAAVAVVAIAAACILPSLFEKEESVSIPDALIPCKEALDQWQSLDSYQIIRQYNRYGDLTGIIGGAIYSKYIKSGDDWMFLNGYTDYTAGQMYRNGVLYNRNTAFDGIYWTPTDDTPEQPHNWPMLFSWENCELIHKITSEDNAGKHIIFSVVEHDPNNSFYIASPYHVCFSFNSNGELEFISVALVGSDNISDLAVSFSTYRLVSDDADTSEQTINEQIVSTDTKVKN